MSENEIALKAENEKLKEDNKRLKDFELFCAGLQKEIIDESRAEITALQARIDRAVEVDEANAHIMSRQQVQINALKAAIERAVACLEIHGEQCRTCNGYGEVSGEHEIKKCQACKGGGTYDTLGQALQDLKGAIE